MLRSCDLPEISFGGSQKEFADSIAPTESCPNRSPNPDDGDSWAAPSLSPSTFRSCFKSYFNNTKIEQNYCGWLESNQGSEGDSSSSSSRNCTPGAGTTANRPTSDSSGDTPAPSEGAEGQPTAGGTPTNDTPENPSNGAGDSDCTQQSLADILKAIAVIFGQDVAKKVANKLSEKGYEKLTERAMAIIVSVLVAAKKIVLTPGGAAAAGGVVGTAGLVTLLGAAKEGSDGFAAGYMGERPARDDFWYMEEYKQGRAAAGAQPLKTPRLDNLCLRSTVSGFDIAVMLERQREGLSNIHRLGKYGKARDALNHCLCKAKLSPAADALSNSAGLTICPNPEDRKRLECQRCTPVLTICRIIAETSLCTYASKTVLTF